MTRKEKIRLWAMRHRGAIRFVISLICFTLAYCFFWAAASAFFTAFGGDYQVAGGAMAGVILLMIAGFFWRGATDFGDWGQEPEYYEEMLERHELEIKALKERK